MYSEAITFKGQLEISIGFHKYYVDNLVTNGGLAYFMARASGIPVGLISHMAVGFSNTAPNRTQTALIDEQARVSITNLAPYTMYSSSDTLMISADFGAGLGTGDIYEAGLFTPNNILVSRAVFPKVIKGAQEAMAVVWRITGGPPT